MKRGGRGRQGRNRDGKSATKQQPKPAEAPQAQKGTRPPRKRRAATDLRKAASHLAYEVEMLASVIHGYRASCNTIAGVEGRTIRNALIEAFAVHWRILDHFLYPHDPDADEVIARDFIEGWRGPRREERKEQMKAARNRANAEVCHLSYKRLDVKEEDKSWDLLHVASFVEPALTKFAEELSAREQDEEVDLGGARVQAAVSELGNKMSGGGPTLGATMLSALPAPRLPEVGATGPIGDARPGTDVRTLGVSDLYRVDDST